VSLIGTLSEVPLGHVLRLLAAGRHSGCLRVASSDGRAMCYFQAGVLVYATGIGSQGDEAVLDLFGWKDGQLEFVIEAPPQALNVTRSVDVLVELGERIGTLPHRIHQVIPNEQIVFQWAEKPPEESFYTVTATDWQIARLLDGVRTVREVIRTSKIPRSDVLRTLCGMAEQGFIERMDIVKTLHAEAAPPFSTFSLLAPSGEADSLSEMDETIHTAWRRVARFAGGVERVKVISVKGMTLNFRVRFRRGVDSAIVLPISAFDGLAIGEGESVMVRPIGSRLHAPRA